MCWLITGFVAPAVPPWGAVLQAAGCLLFSLHIVGIALALFSKQAPWEPWNILDPLTTQSLADSGSVDLIVWPEACLTDSWRDGSASNAPSHHSASESRQRLTLQDFAKQLTPSYQTNSLLGVNMIEKGTAVKYGLTVPTTKLINCGCLVKTTGEIDCHEKQILVPLKEGLPDWFPTEFVRQRILPFFDLKAPYAGGRNFHLLRFHDRTGVERTIAAAVCYESWHPWLPQFHQPEKLDAIVYMMYDGDFVDHPELIQRQLLSVRLRAIETRTWSLVCSTWRGTAVIDPRGRIVKELPPVAGVLRTDEL